MTVPANDHWTLDLDKLGMEAAGDRLAELILREVGVDVPPKKKRRAR